MVTRVERSHNPRSKGKSPSRVRSANQTAKTKARTPAPRNLRFLHLGIEIVQHPEPEQSEELGQWDIRHARIMYDASAKPEVTRETLLHEALHVVLEHTGVENYLHEEIIASMSPLLLHILRANPQFVRYLCAD